MPSQDGLTTSVRYCISLPDKQPIKTFVVIHRQNIGIFLGIKQQHVGISTCDKWSKRLLIIKWFKIISSIDKSINQLNVDYDEGNGRTKHS